MKMYTFPYGGSTGKHDTWDSFANIEISDRDALRLEKSARKEPRWRLDEDPDISDIYNRVYRKIEKQNIEELKSIGRWAELVADNPGETEDELLEREMGIWSISFPEELQGIGDI